MRDELGRAVLAERLRSAEVRRRAGSPPPRSRLRSRIALWLSRGDPRADRVHTEIEIRFATEADRVTWPELGTAPADEVLIAEFNGSPHAALSLVDGAVLAPAEPATALPLLELLEQHADRLESGGATDSPASRQGRRFRRI